MPKLKISTDGKRPAIELSSLEKDVLQLISEGCRGEDICETLGLSHTEVDKLMKDVEERLGAKNRLHAVTIAVLNGHITIGPENPV